VILYPFSLICVFEHNGNALSKKSKTNLLSNNVILDTVKH